jgi:TolA-binding protein
LNKDKLFGRVRTAGFKNLSRVERVMRAIVLFALSATLVVGVSAWQHQPAGARQKDEKKDSKASAKDAAKEAGRPTAAADVTRTKSLKAKMTVDFKDARLGDILKEFAAQVDMRADTRLLWAYGKDFPYAQKVSYTCKDKPLDVALDELFKKVGTLGYIVVSKDGDKYDGWVLLTTTGERGAEKGAEPLPKLTDAEEADAADKLTLAKKLIADGKDDKAKTVLNYVLKKYPGSKIVPEAKELLAKLEK